jgi:hypothetical protein
MSGRYFRHYIFERDEDVVFVGLDNWLERDKNALLGPYLCNEAEVNARFDEIETDLKRCRRETLAAVSKLPFTKTLSVKGF